MKKLGIIIIVLLIMTSCVSNKKYTDLQKNYDKTLSEKGTLEQKLGNIKRRVNDYNSKINSLKASNEKLSEQAKTSGGLAFTADSKVPLSKEALAKMKNKLADVDPSVLSGLKTLNDSINYILNSNINKGVNSFEGLDFEVDETVVMINVSDNLLFNTGSYKVSNEAYPLLQKLSNIIKSEPSIEVMVEGHTDSRVFRAEALEDNWDLSVKRATSIVRLLQDKYNVAPEQLIASGRSSYAPLAENDSGENRALNRRTRIIIMPNLDKFLSMVMAE